MNRLLYLSIALLAAWAVLRLGFAVAEVILHALWILALILALIWFIGKPRSGE